MASTTKGELYNALISNCDNILQRADQFLGPQKQVEDDLKRFTKKLYDLTKRDEINQIPSSVALRNLIIDDFDDEQIWQELELQNRAYKNDCVNFISKVIASSQRTGKRLTFASCGKKNDDVDDDVSILDHSEIESQTHSEVEDNVESENDDAEDSKVIALGGRLSFEDADDSMSDISIELEKALDKRIALDKDNSSSSSDDDERNDYDDKGGSRLKEKDDSDKDTEAIDQSETNKTHIDAPKQKKNKLKRSIVDDTFFKLSELELFLDSEDAKEERRLRSTLSRFPENSKEWDDDINYFEDIQSGNEDEYDSGDSKAEHKRSYKLKYSDFFDPPESDGRDDDTFNRNQTVDVEHVQDKEDPEMAFTDDDDDDAEEEEGDDDDDSVKFKEQTVKSSFERRQEKLKEKIKVLEENNLSAKPWQLLGEASAAARPENSLLQEHLQFDHMTRQAPVITEETTEKLEDIIKRRIKDKVWDDVERKIKPKEDPYEYKKRIILDQEKSKLSLAEVYEQEYLKQQQTDKSKEQEEPVEHKEIRQAMTALFLKLDALSNFHFVPKPVAPEVKIVNNLPAIVVEDVAPVTMTDASMLAPEEIKRKRKGELKGKSERTTTDKKHERRSKKSLQRKRQQFKLAKEKEKSVLKSGLGNKYSKMAAMKELAKEGNVTVLDENVKEKKSRKITSKDFFDKLQDEVKMSIELKASGIKKRKVGKKLSAVKLKL